MFLGTQIMHFCPLEFKGNPLGLEDNKMQKFTEQQEQAEIDYYRAEKIAKTMLNSELISLCEYNKLTELNRQSFSPFLAEIMPKMT